MRGGDELFGICSLLVLEAHLEVVRRLGEDAAVGGNRSLAVLKTTSPHRACAALHTPAAPSGSWTPRGFGTGMVTAGGRGAGASAGLWATGRGSRSRNSCSARAKNSSLAIFPASTSARIDFCALYSRFSMPALLCSIRHALRRSTQKSTSWRESDRYSTSLPAP